MPPVKTIQDGGGDSLLVGDAAYQIKSTEGAENTAKHPQADPYEGPPHKSTEAKDEVGREEPRCLCSHTDGGEEEKKSQQKPAKKETYRPHKDVAPTKSDLPPILTDCFFDDETESSPILVDKSNEVRLQRQRQYRQELTQQISQREETRAQRKTKKNPRTAQRRQEPADYGSRSAVDSYENQLRMEQMDEMRRHLAKQREREVQRLRRIYRSDDRKFQAHLHRLKLQEKAEGQGDGDGGVPASSAPSVSSPADLHKEFESKPESIAPEVSLTGEPEKVASPRVVSNRSEEKQMGHHLQARQSPSTSVSRSGEKPPNKPISVKRAYLRLQHQRRAEEMLLEEQRAKSEAWKSELARQQRLQRDVRNMAEWRTVRSLAGVPLVPISSAQKCKFEAAASWLEKSRAAQQEKRIERDRELSSWRDEKDRQIQERRMKEKAEQKVAREMQNERRKEAEKSYQRWMLEIRARKAAERASIPRGAIGVSTYSSAYSLPSPWRPPPKQSWREKKSTPASLDKKRNENFTHNVLS